MTIQSENRIFMLQVLLLMSVSTIIIPQMPSMRRQRPGKPRLGGQSLACSCCLPPCRTGLQCHPLPRTRTHENRAN
jgi:hypothetical protein